MHAADTSDRPRSPFEAAAAQDINAARGEVVRTIASALRSDSGLATAIDVGCGGLAFFAATLRDCGYRARAVDGRAENVDAARRHHPDLDVDVFDVEDPGLSSLGRFDLVLAFGLLYHLENPFAAIRNLAALSRNYLLIETQTAPRDGLGATLYTEPHEPDQALRYLALVANERSVVKMLYRAGFASVYRA